MIHAPEAPQTRPATDEKLPLDIQQFPDDSEILELARSIFSRAGEVFDRTRPLAHTIYARGIGTGTRIFSARQFELDQNSKHYELQQSDLVIRDNQKIWNSTRVTSFRDNNRWSLMGPKSLRLTKDRRLDATADEARIVMNDMRKALEDWLLERENTDTIGGIILPVWDRLDGFVQGFSHRVSPPKD